MSQHLQCSEVPKPVYTYMVYWLQCLWLKLWTKTLPKLQRIVALHVMTCQPVQPHIFISQQWVTPQGITAIEPRVQGVDGHYRFGLMPHAIVHDCCA